MRQPGMAALKLRYVLLKGRCVFSELNGRFIRWLLGFEFVEKCVGSGYIVYLHIRSWDSWFQLLDAVRGFWMSFGETRATPNILLTRSGGVEFAAYGYWARIWMC